MVTVPGSLCEGTQQVRQSVSSGRQWIAFSISEIDKVERED